MKLRKKLKNSNGNLDKKSLTAYAGLLFVALGLVAVPAASQIQLYNGAEVKLNGGDIVDGGNTVYDSSAGEIPDSVLGIDLSTNAGSYLTWDSANNEFDVDSSSIQSSTTASDVGLGNVENIALSNAAGSFLTWDSTNKEFNVDSSLDTNANTECSGSDTFLSGDGTCETYSTGSGDGYLPDDPADSSVDMNNYDINNIDNLGSESEKISDVYAFDFYGDLRGNVVSDEDVILIADDNQDSGGSYRCEIDRDTGAWTCDGDKQWRHELNSTHNAYYSSQESPEVRAVYEGKAHIVDSKKIKLPSHFSKTVSNSKPMLRAQVTPQGTFTKAVVMDKTDDYVEIKVGKETDVNFRITGIREGYEDKDVVRQKEE